LRPNARQNCKRKAQWQQQVFLGNAKQESVSLEWSAGQDDLHKLSSNPLWSTLISSVISCRFPGCRVLTFVIHVCVVSKHTDDFVTSSIVQKHTEGHAYVCTLMFLTQQATTTLQTCNGVATANESTHTTQHCANNCTMPECTQDRT